MKLNQNRLTELISKRVIFDFQILLKLKIIIGEDYLINLKLINVFVSQQIVFIKASLTSLFVTTQCRLIKVI